MISFPNAKINLGLSVCARREDGYHDLETVFIPIPLYDVLEIVDASSFSFSFSGLEIPGEFEDNLLFKVFKRFQKDFKIPTQRIVLHKQIPMGAGLGGGSADAAFLINLLNKKFDLGLGLSQLEEYAALFGADCAFFIKNKSVLATGIGNEFHPISLPSESFYLGLIKPPIHVSTAQAYAQVRPAIPSKTLTTVLKQPIATWKTDLINDFEPGVFAINPSLALIKDQLYKTGALYAAMSGSGSTLFGLFGEKPDLRNFEVDNFVFCEKIKF